MTSPAQRRRNILILMPRLNVDGTTHLVSTLLKGLNRNNYHVTLCALSPGNARLEELRACVDEIVILSMRSFWDIRVLWPLYVLLRRRRIELIHTHRIRPDIMGRIAGAMAGVRSNISTQHYVEEWRERGRFVHFMVRLLYRLTLPLCQFVVCISAAERAVLLSQLGARQSRKAIVIHNGLDVARYDSPSTEDLEALRRELGLDRDTRIVTTVAFLNQRKGHRYLLDAAARLLAEHPKLTLLLVGDGTETQSLTRQAEALGIAEQTRFLGLRTDVPAVLALSDVVVLPSLWEPFGLALLEAMAAARPVVATDAGGPAEIVVNHQTGLLVPPANAHALADALGYLLSHREKAAAMGRAGRARLLECFSAPRMSRCYQELYDELLGAGPGSD